MIPVVPRNAPKVIVIGAGLGGLSAAMRLGAKGYRVTIIDRLDRLGGRGSSISKNGYRFDLGPTILTVPDVFRRLWSDCGREMAFVPTILHASHRVPDVSSHSRPPSHDTGGIRGILSAFFRYS